jgi:hypothetical protein
MQKTIPLVLGSSLLSAGAAILVMTALRKKEETYTFTVLKDTDMRDSKKIDKKESVDADKDPSEKGLTQFDSALKSEWVANGFPQTHQEMRELENQV